MESLKTDLQCILPSIKAIVFIEKNVPKHCFNIIGDSISITIPNNRDIFDKIKDVNWVLLKTKNLVVLDLSNMGVNNFWIKCIAEIPKFSYVFQNLKVLNLSGNELTNESRVVTLIKILPPATTIDLRYNPSLMNHQERIRDSSSNKTILM